MRRLLLFIGLMLSVQSSFAIELENKLSWEIVKEDQDFYIKLKSDKKVMADIQGFGQDPQIEKVECSQKIKLCYVIYFAGEVGTQRLVKAWRAVLYDYSSGFYVGDFPYKYSDGDRAFPQPEYIQEGTRLIIKDETSGVEEVIQLNQKR